MISRHDLKNTRTHNKPMLSNSSSKFLAEKRKDREHRWVRGRAEERESPPEGRGPPAR